MQCSLVGKMPIKMTCVIPGGLFNQVRGSLKLGSVPINTLGLEGNPTRNPACTDRLTNVRPT